MNEVMTKTRFLNGFAYFSSHSLPYHDDSAFSSFLIIMRTHFKDQPAIRVFYTYSEIAF